MGGAASPSRPLSVGSWWSVACQWGGGGGGRDEPDRRVTVEERRRRDKAGGGCWRRESLIGAHRSRSEGDCSRAEVAAPGVVARGSASTRGTAFYILFICTVFGDPFPIFGYIPVDS
ncbi:hypothetical protein AV530_017392 [Patagioenas fasciata monilis]|uniref:Uncharacterized protein n=1 Tax=Patagioenas fasciata monilis TaxID=372326 RepID=A0A1V4JFX5_PATFA|nr:hypothetical protein AV530_017392 [Patagioenas fasciata monilis]